jgi:hypothetical protein
MFFLSDRDRISLPEGNETRTKRSGIIPVREKKEKNLLLVFAG